MISKPNSMLFLSELPGNITLCFTVASLNSLEYRLGKFAFNFDSEFNFIQLSVT